MTAPNLELTIHPKVGGAVRYLPLAQPKPGGAKRFQLSFHARIRNGGTVPVTVTALTVRFPAGSAIPDKSIPLKTDGTVGLMIAPGQTGAPQDFVQADNIVLSVTPPGTIEFLVSAQGFSDPAHFSYPLAGYKNQAAPGGYRCFALPHELRRKEYWKGQSTVHCCGPQLFAHDLVVMGFNGNGWTELLPGKNGSKNTDYRCWGKSILAMADGTVVSFLNNVPDNPQPGTVLPNQHTYGSHFILRHGEAEVIYAHMQKGSLNPALTSQGAQVTKGQFLGKAGNSGNSSNAHLHVHSVGHTSQMLRPVPFGETVVTQMAGTGDGEKPWVLATNQGLPAVESLFYPSSVPPADDAEWSEWEGLGGVLESGIVVSSWLPDRLDVFARGTDAALWHKWWDGTKWHAWESLGGVITSRPAAVSWGPFRIDVFARGTDNALWHKWWDGTKWRAWESLGGVMVHGPAVCSRHLNHLDVFALGTDQALYQRIWTGNHWTPWAGLGGVLTSDLAAVSWDANRIDVFGRGTDDSLWHQWWDGSTWSGWVSHNKKILFGPTVSSRAANRLDVFVVAEDNTVHHKLWTGSKWSGWETVGGFVTAEPAAVSWSQNRIDLFARAIDNSLYHTYWEPG